MINELDTIYNQAFTEKNRRHVKICEEAKQKTKKFKDMELYEEAYKDFPDAEKLVVKFKDRIKRINDIKCGVVPSSPPPPRPCQVDSKKIIDAAGKINDLVNKYRNEKKKDEQTFSKIVRETDDYLKSLPESCKNNSDNKQVIEQYQGMKSLYLKYVK